MRNPKQLPVEVIDDHAEYVLAPPQASLLANYSGLPQSELAPSIATWDMTTDAGIARLHQCVEGMSISIWDACELATVELVVEHLAASYREYESEDTPGEVVRGPVLSLVGPQDLGRVYHTGSKQVFRALQRLAAHIGAPPWVPAVRLLASRQSTRNRRVRQCLVYLGRVP